MTENHPSIEALLAQGPSFAQLARSLVVDDSEAEDVVQEAWLRALRRPPRRGTNLRAWMQRVVQNRARDAGRSASRRRRHETAAAQTGQVDPGDVAERVELQRRLAGAVLDLDEPYRTVILLRYFEQLKPARIAQRLGRPVATIHTHIQRGLKALRQRLDAEFGERGTWQMALLPLLAGTASLALMRSLVAVAVLLLTLGTTCWWSSRPDAPSTSIAQAGSGKRDLSVGQPATPVPSGTSELPRAALPRPDSGSSNALTAPPEPSCTLVGRCVDEGGRPLAGVQVQLRGHRVNAGRTDAYERLHGKLDWSAPRAQLSDGDGRFELEFAHVSALQFGLSLESQGRVDPGLHWERLSAGRHDLGEILLRRGVQVQGTVTDTQGRPVSGREVDLKQLGPLEAERRRFGRSAEGLRFLSATTDARGRFRCRKTLPTGRYEYSVRNEQVIGNGITRFGADQPTHALHIRVRPADEIPRIRGQIVDPEGKPLQRARISAVGLLDGRELLGEHLSTHIQSKGHFELSRAPAHKCPGVRIEVRADGFETYRGVQAVTWGTEDHRIIMRPGVGLELRVVDHRDQTVEAFGAFAFPPPAQASLSSEDTRVRSRGEHPGGVLLLQGLARGPRLVVVETNGEDRTRSRPQRIDLRGASRQSLDVRIPRSLDVVLTVRGENDAPVAGTQLEVLDPLPGKTVSLRSYALRLDSLGGSSSRDQALFCAGGTTDEHGRLRIKIGQGTGYVLRALGPGHLPTIVRDVEFRGDRAEVVIRVAPGARIHGKLRPADLVAATLARAKTREHWFNQCGLGLRPFSFAGPFAPPPSTYRRGIPLGSEGSYEISGIPPGDWQVFYRLRNGDTHVLGEVRGLAAGESREVDLDLSGMRPATGQIRALINGEPAAHTNLTLRCHAKPNEKAISFVLDARGQGSYEVLPNRYQAQLFLRPKHGQWSMLPANRDALQLQAGRSSDLVLHFQHGTVQLELKTPDGGPAIGVALLTAQPARAWRWQQALSDPEGRIEGLTPTGEVELLVVPKREPKTAGKPFLELPKPIPVGRIQVRSGETSKLVLRLPEAAGY